LRLSLFPEDTRRETWAELREVSQYRIRELDYPRIVRNAGFLLAAAVVFIEHFQLWQLPAVRWLWPLLGMLGLWMLFETYAKLLPFFDRFRVRFPSGMITVKDLCRAVLSANYVELHRDGDIELDDRSAEVWRKLTEIIADTVGVDAEEVTFRSRLIRDLGMD